MNMPEKSLLIDLHYFPSIEYFTALFRYEKIVFEVEEHFEKQTYRNRCHILSANKMEKLSLPVIGGRKKIKTKDITIDHTQRWQKDHWRAIKSAYGRAPFFEFYAPYFEPLLLKEEKFLVDFNLKILTICLQLLQTRISYSLSETYIKSPDPSKYDDLRSVIHPKRSFTENNLYEIVAYPQVFGNDFVPNLSIIDLLFCEGPNAKNIVTKSFKAE